MDIYRIAWIVVVLTFGWIVALISLKQLWREFEDKPEEVNLFEYYPDGTTHPNGSPGHSVRWIGEHIKGRKTMDVCAYHAEAASRKGRMWRWGLVSLGGMIWTFVAAQRFWKNWIVSLGCVFVGPAMIMRGFEDEHDPG